MEKDKSMQSTQPEAKIQNKDRFKEFLRRFNETVLVPIRYEQLTELRSRVDQGKIEITESLTIRRYHPAQRFSISRASLEEAMRELEALEKKYGKQFLEDNLI